ncbi:MAG: DUF2630 family protein [Solirubrobacteraceae bacterium]|nr:DUF2630 family protein [Solirubrobacteraceae bacterium]
MDDTRIQDHIEELVAEEHRLLETAGESGDGLDAAGHTRLKEIGVELDQYWDLLRQRRAKREFGLPVSDAGLRDAGTVEGYEG